MHSLVQAWIAGLLIISSVVIKVFWLFQEMRHKGNPTLMDFFNFSQNQAYEAKVIYLLYIVWASNQDTFKLLVVVWGFLH